MAALSDKEYTLAQKSDTVVIDTFKDIRLDFIPIAKIPDANQNN